MALEVEEDENGNEGVVIRATSSRRKRGKKESEDESAPVENDEPIPLFPHLDKDKENIVSVIRVFKRDPPGEGYKGDIHPTASLDFVAKRWGNGIYDFQALNAEHRILRRNDNITIASQPRAIAAATESNGSAAERLLDRQAQAFERDQDRTYRISTEALASTRQQAQSYAEMVRADTEARMQRDREHFAQSQTQQQAFFQQMFLQTQQMHQMSIEQQRTSFEQVLQLMVASHERESATNNPLVMVEVLQRGFQLAAEMGGEGDPLSTAMQTGLGGLREITKMMALQKGLKTPKLAKRNPPANAKNGQKPAEKRAPVMTREEIQQVLDVKKAAEAKGYDFEGILAQAKSMVAAAPDQSEDDDDTPTEDDDSNDSQESGAPDVDGGKPSK